MNAALNELLANLNTLASEVATLKPDVADAVQIDYQTNSLENKEHFDRELLGNVYKLNVHAKGLTNDNANDKIQIINIAKKLQNEIPFCKKVNETLSNTIQDPLNQIESLIKPNSPRPGRR